MLPFFSSSLTMIKSSQQRPGGHIYCKLYFCSVNTSVKSPIRVKLDCCSAWLLLDLATILAVCLVRICRERKISFSNETRGCKPNPPSYWDIFLQLWSLGSRRIMFPSVRTDLSEGHSNLPFSLSQLKFMHFCAPC